MRKASPLIEPEIDPTRSALMSRIKGKNTKPELVVRRAAHALGYRFRLHRKGLPGSPDLVFVGRRKIVFVHGCYWHRHSGCRKASNPSTRCEFWQSKFARNVARDAEVERKLRAERWDVLTIWECQTKDVEALARTLKEFLETRA